MTGKGPAPALPVADKLGILRPAMAKLELLQAVEAVERLGPRSINSLAIYRVCMHAQTSAGGRDGHGPLSVDSMLVSLPKRLTMQTMELHGSKRNIRPSHI